MTYPQQDNCNQDFKRHRNRMAFKEGKNSVRNVFKIEKGHIDFDMRSLFSIAKCLKVNSRD